MELKYIKTGDYELSIITLSDNKKRTINKYVMLRLDYLQAHKKHFTQPMNLLIILFQ